MVCYDRSNRCICRKNDCGKQPVLTAKANFDLGWISPEGKLFPCQFQDHEWCAEKIVADYRKVEIPSFRWAEDYLEKQGWIKVGSIAYAGMFNPNGVSLLHVPTKKQIRAIQEIGRWDESVEKWIEELRIIEREKRVNSDDQKPHL